MTILLAAATLGSGLRWHAARGRLGVVVACVTSAAMNLLGGVGGPAAGIYSANAGWPAAQIRAALQAYLLGLNLMTLSLIGFVAVPLVFVAALVVGSIAGILAAGSIPDATVRAASLVLAAAGGAAVLVQALV